MSPVNGSVVHALWASAPSPSHLTGITGFGYDPGIAAEERLLAELDNIDLHHGPYSTNSPYTVLEVIGAQLIPAIQDALSELGFSAFKQSPGGFVATRSEEEATRLRD
ncbi:MAG: hypothetical protein QOK29_742 [Rhodospirillaceae bacterium]|jgi:hypothetical protein|nr:hypothetical protein [Rhodospirillaceae bacterium]